MNQTITPCSFCSQIAGDLERNAMYELLGTAWAQHPLIAETPHSVVIPSIGALVPGHVLVCPRRHFRSVLRTPTAVHHDLAREAHSMAALLESRTGAPVHRFEHGSSSNAGGRVACSVEHAHLHLLPADVDVRAALSATADWMRVSDERDTLARLGSTDEYLTYRAPSGERFLAVSSTGFPSQILRQILARALGIGEEWNWRVHPALDRITATVEVASAARQSLARVAAC